MTMKPISLTVNITIDSCVYFKLSGHFKTDVTDINLCYSITDVNLYQ